MKAETNYDDLESTHKADLEVPLRVGPSFDQVL